MSRSSDGKTRTDHGDYSLITDLKAAQTIRLDHVKKEAQLFPIPAAPAAPKAPAGAAPSFTPPNSPLNVKDLGKRMMGGHEVEGKSYTYPVPQPPAAPQPPTAPKPSQVASPPGLPGAPSLPPSVQKMPASPPPPKVPAQPQEPKTQTLEVWTSPKFQLPMATRVTGDMGKQTTINKQVTPGEPPTSTFQIPPGYKIVPPPHAPTPSS